MCHFSTFILIITIIEIESISDRILWDYNDNLLGKIDEFYPDNRNIETHPIKEGFLLLNDNPKKSPLQANKTTTTTTTTTESSSIQITTEDDMNSFLRIDDKLLDNDEAIFDGSGETTELTTEETTTMSNTPTISRNITTTTTTTTPSTSLITNTTTIPILEQFNQTFPHVYSLNYSEISNTCPRSSNININMTFLTSNDITVLTTLFQVLDNIVSKMGIILQSFNKCGTNDIVQVQNVTSCYLINLCNLCGINPRRGICLSEYNLSKCQCFTNENDPTIVHSGDFCQIQQKNPTTSITPSWSAIIIGILAGLAGLFCATTICLLVTTFIRRYSKKNKSFDQNGTRISRFSYLPRAKLPTIVTNEHIPDYLDNTLSTSNTESEFDPNLFFQELDEDLFENQQTIIPRVNSSSEIISIRSIYDPINELDAIINDEEISMTFHEPIDLDNELFEIINPNLDLD